MQRGTGLRIALQPLRAYATAAIPHNEHHKKYDLHPWPTSKKPTPHEIFDLDHSAHTLSTKDFNQRLKKCYVKYVKIYHPDVCKNLPLLDTKGRVMSDDEKRLRYDAIQYAYDVLKDPRRRMAYQRSQTTAWENYQHNSNTSSFEAYRMANAHRKKYDFEQDEQFWKAGTWEDYYRMRYNRAPPTQEEFDKNKFKILYGVLAVAAVVVSLQIMVALDNAEQYRRRAEFRNIKLGNTLVQSQENYGEGTSPLLRLRRFLSSRRAAMATRDESKLAEGLQNDQEMVRRYAQQRLAAIEAKEME